MAQTAPGSVRRVLRRTIYCPLSGTKLGKDTIKTHSIPLQVCSNGTLFGHCKEHDVRVFVRNSPIIRQIMKAETVVPQKERTHGP